MKIGRNEESLQEDKQPALPHERSQSDAACEDSQSAEDLTPQWPPVASVKSRIRPPKRRRRERSVAFIKELVIIVVLAFTISGLVKHFLVQNYEVPTGSMLETLQIGDRIAVSKLVPSLREVHRGDIVVFSDSQNWLAAENQNLVKPNPVQAFFMMIGVLPESRSNHLVKRVIGVGGDNVMCCNSDGLLVVNGKPIVETYLRPGVAPSTRRFDVKVPAGHLWVMGDNRSNSADSRAHMAEPGGGFVPLTDVTGRAFLRWWPLNRWGTLGAEQVFKDVPAATGQ